jgi:hypothetical protein
MLHIDLQLFLTDSVLPAHAVIVRLSSVAAAQPGLETHLGA